MKKQGSNKFSKTEIIKNPEIILNDKEIMSALVEAEIVPNKNVVDLRGVLIKKLENELGYLSNFHETVVDTAYKNSSALLAIQNSILVLLKKDNISDFLLSLEIEVANFLNANSLHLLVEDTLQNIFNHPSVIPCRIEHIQDYIKNPINDEIISSIQLRKYNSDLDMFSDITFRNNIESEAVLPISLQGKTVNACLILRSTDANKFHSKQETDLLSFFQEAVQALMNKWLIT